MRIAVLDDWAGAATRMADWHGLGAEVTVFRDTLHGEDALAERLAPFEVLCLMRERTRMPGTLIARLPKLKLIVTTGMRNLAIDGAAAATRGITLCGTETRKTSTSELAMGLLLALSRGIVHEAWAMRGGGWQTGLGRDLDGMTLGLVGLGSIGAQMAERARVFGMEPVAWSQNLTEARCAEVGAGYRPSLGALMADADAVSIHLVLSERTRGLVGAEALAAMKPDAMLINTSRGPIVDAAALIAALRAAPERRAALDVFETEPLPADDPLRDRDLIDRGQLLLTPHLGYVTQATWRLFYAQTVENIHAWKAGRPLRVIAA
ncbi:D-2-hydroxyacid dehydrogenase family protein [soil metagenome]